VGVTDEPPQALTATVTVSPGSPDLLYRTLLPKSSLSAAIGAELTAIESIERRADENRRVRYAVAAGFISVVAIPASLILGFLGINASQVRSGQSMFSHHYLAAYLAVGAVMVLGAALSVTVWLQQRRDARHQRAPAQRPRWTPAPGQLPGVTGRLTDPVPPMRGGAQGEPARDT
jgi:hypothetical protein